MDLCREAREEVSGDTCFGPPSHVEMYPLLFVRDQDPEAEKRREMAWCVAKQASRILREQFGARKVVAFGSLCDPDSFTRWSDLDLAVWGIRPHLYYQAVAAVIDLCPELSIDLVDAECCRDSVRSAIEKDGIVV